MKKVVFILAVIFLVSGCTFFQLGEKSYSGGRGVVISFLPGKPPTDEIILGVPFFVAVKFTNYITEAINVQYKVYDTIGVLTENTGLDLDAAVMDGSNYTEMNRILSLGKKLIDVGDGEQFFASVSYEINREFNPTICLGEIETIIGAEKCVEVLEGDKLSNNQNDPVIISSIKRQVSGGDVEGYYPYLEFRIDNLGGGEIKALIFSMEQFECHSKNAILGQDSGLSLRIEDYGIVKCYLVNEGLKETAGTAYPMKVSLGFTYEYKIRTNEIRVVGKT